MISITPIKVKEGNDKSLQDLKTVVNLSIRCCERRMKHVTTMIQEGA
jgi:hypothetical protein